MREPISSITSIAYLLFGGGIYGANPTPESLVMLGSMAFLTAGSMVMHAKLRTQTWAVDMDHAGMNATFAALATFAAGGPWYLMLVAAVAAAVVLEYIMDIWNYPVMGVFLWVAIAAAVGLGHLVLLGASLAAFALAFALWINDGSWLGIPKDYTHGLGWHTLTALATYLMWIAVGGLT